MDFSDHTKIVLGRIQRFEGEMATNIVGYLLMRGTGEQEMVKLASLPDQVLKELASNIKMEIPRMNTKPSSDPALPPLHSQQHGFGHSPIINSRSCNSLAGFPRCSTFLEPHANTNTMNTDYMPLTFLDSIEEFQNQAQSFGLGNTNIDTAPFRHAEVMNGYFNLDCRLSGNLSERAVRRSSSEYPVKACHYFIKGFCKHGNSCRFSHDSERLPQMFDIDAYDDQFIISSSLAQLELELIQLLKPRRGHPISIATLPSAYYEKYGKSLQADGYLTESQRHGKSGYSLTKLLARLKNTIRLIDRPHGQHDVVLMEDAIKYLERGESAQNFNAARQIYLTFPADCSFTEDDVSNYFKIFGTVEDVRIPCQEKRMFGFVTFADPESVKTVLEKKNPHYVQGSRVLVKPYKERSKIMEKKYRDRNEPYACFPPQYTDIHSEITSVSGRFDNPMFMRGPYCEEQELPYDFQRHFAEMQLTENSVPNPFNHGFSMDELKAPMDPSNFQPTEYLNNTATDIPRDIKINGTNEDIKINGTNEDSNQGVVNLPDSPFSFLDS